MMKYAVMCVALAAGVCCATEGTGTAATRGKKPNALELMRPVDELIDQAQALYEEGESKEAIEVYRQALEKLTDIELEHFDWVTSPEFAPVRSRRVLCDLTIDRIILDDAKMFSRTMTVSDTRELERKREERQRAAAEADAEVTAPVRLGSKGGDEMDGDDLDELLDEMFGIDEELELVKDLIQLERFTDAERSLVKVLRVTPENRETRFLMALTRVRQGRNSDALVGLDDLLADDPMDEPVLLLAGGAYMATGAYGKAIDALDRAMRVNPKRPDALINMAWLLLEMRQGDTTEAEQYYRLAVERLGAPRVRELERRLGIGSE